ncbi:MAG: peptidoglycan DD-metalloendopeptidase family protein [Rhodobacteraceae bacterium]|nr:peptidoglycan DD-metalloendopeptidase family protein [Paracoccaceae bacterium]
MFKRYGLGSASVKVAASVSLLALAGCDTGLDIGGYNLRDPQAPVANTAPRPEADARGVISYPNYQMAVARSGDTVASVAARIGLGGEELARHNGLVADYALRPGELLALPRRVAANAASGVDITTIASNAITTAEAGKPPADGAVTAGAGRIEPIRHRVERGETAYSIARLYDVSVTALAKWNGLGSDLAVREGQQLLIPVVEAPASRIIDDSKPGKGTPTPMPPSAAKPLPETVKTATLPPSPDLGKLKTRDDRKFLTPVDGDILQGYSGKSGGNEGIDIAALPGTAVKAAEDGEVALISKSVGSSIIVLLRHADNIYTVYSNVTGVSVKKGDKIKRGQPIGKVADGSPSYLHFEVRRGTESVDPAPYL